MSTCNLCHTIGLSHKDKGRGVIDTMLDENLALENAYPVVGGGGSERMCRKVSSSRIDGVTEMKCMLERAC